MVLPTTAVSLVGRHEPRLVPYGVRITAFLDPSVRCSRDDALRYGSPSLLHRVLTRELASDEPLVIQRWVWTTLQTTMSLPLVQCLVAFIHPDRSLWEVVVPAIATGDLPLVQWLYAFALKRDSPAAARAAQDLVLRETVLRGDLEIVRWVLDQRPSSLIKPKPIAMDMSGLAKRLASDSEGTSTEASWLIVELLLERLGFLAHRSLPMLAAQHGRLQTIQCMRTHRVAMGLSIVNAAAARGHFDLVEDLGMTPSSHAIDDAAMYDNLEVLEILRTRFQCAMSTNAILRAADNGHVTVLQYAWTHFPDQTYWTDLSGLLMPAFLAAVDGGHLKAVTWLYETHLGPLLSTKTETNQDRPLIQGDTIYQAFKNNHIAVVQYLHAHGLIDWDQWDGSNATYYCDLPALQWLDSQHLFGPEPRNELVCAVHAGRLDCIQWVLDHRPMGSTSFSVEYAMLRGRLDVLELLLSKGVPSTSRAIDFAAAKGYIDAIRRLVAYRQGLDPPFEGDQATVAALHGACLAGHLDVVKYLTEHPVRGGECTTAAMDDAASKGYLELVQYLHTHRSEGCTVAAMDTAAANGDLPMVQFLLENRTEGCSSAALESAATKGHFDMVQLLIAHYPEIYSSTTVQRARAKGELEIALWLEQWAAASGAPSTSMPQEKSRSITTEIVLPPATPIVG